MKPQKPTSKAAHEFIKPHKQTHKDKILVAFGKLPVGGTHEELAEASGLRPDQVWKRISELCSEGKIFDTGITRKLKSGLHGSVWQITNRDDLVSDTQQWFSDYQDGKFDPPVHPIEKSFYQSSLF